MIRAWRSFDRFEGRSAMRSWLYRIATNVCLDMLGAPQRRARPMDLRAGIDGRHDAPAPLPENTWIEPIPDDRAVPTGGDPADVAVARESIRLAFVAALQHLPARQRAVLILREVLHWKADEVAELLGTTVASVNSALQRARATLATSKIDATKPADALDDDQEALLARYVQAFEQYDMDRLTALLQEDATWNMPPYDLWLQTHRDIVDWCLGTGIGCRARGCSRSWPTGRRPSRSTSPRPMAASSLVDPGARTVGRSHQRHHVLPGHRAVLPDVRPTAAARRLRARPRGSRPTGR